METVFVIAMIVFFVWLFGEAGKHLFSPGTQRTRGTRPGRSRRRK